MQNAKIKETDDKITITIPHCTIDEDSIKIKSSDLKIYDTNFAIMSVDKEAVMELVGEAEKKSKKKADSDEYGFLETPYRKVDKEKGVVTDECVYCMADAEDSCYIAQAVEPLTEDKRFVNARVLCRYKNSIVEVPSTKVDLMDVSPKQFISAATSLIPFLNNNDTPRALMGANMQRQAVPVLRPEAPIV